MLPDYFSHLLFRPPNHNYNTRRRRDLNVTKVKHEFAKRRILYCIPTMINNTTNFIIEKIFSHSLSGFSMYIKNHFISNYQMSCTLLNCYVCHRY